ncbi:MAG: hypothetical protein WC755_09265 [Candidatus Woesearchaeota archaeon]|jgi:hypothetical protein
MPTFLVIKKIRKKDDGKAVNHCDACSKGSKFTALRVKIEKNRVVTESELFICVDHLEEYARSMRLISRRYYERLKKTFDKTNKILNSKIP